MVKLSHHLSQVGDHSHVISLLSETQGQATIRQGSYTTHNTHDTYTA